MAVKSGSKSSSGSSRFSLASSSSSVEVSVLSSCSHSDSHQSFELLEVFFSFLVSHLCHEMSSEILNSSRELELFLSEEMDSSSEIGWMSNESSLVELSLLESVGSHLQLGSLSDSRSCLLSSLFFLLFEKLLLSLVLMEHSKNFLELDLGLWALLVLELFGKSLEFNFVLVENLGLSG